MEHRMDSMMHRIPDGLPVLVTIILAAPAWILNFDFGALYHAASAIGTLTAAVFTVVKFFQNRSAKKEIAETKKDIAELRAELRAELKTARVNGDAQLTEIETRLREIEGEVNK